MKISSESQQISLRLMDVDVVDLLIIDNDNTPFKNCKSNNN
jgi:hypothetical protein